MLHMFEHPTTWQDTLPHHTRPQPDEWVVGLLLRCDEINHWAAGSTLACLRRDRSSHSSTTSFNLLAPSPDVLFHLARVLNLPFHHILATTYQAELGRVAGIAFRLSLQTQTAFALAVCPECLTESRRLTRPCMLPFVQVCRHHQVKLQDQCQCGEYLKAFSRKATPFCCHACGLDWQHLPREEASPAEAELERMVRAYFRLLIAQGTPQTLARVLGLIEEREMERDKKSGMPPRHKTHYRSISRLLSHGTLTFENMVFSLVRLKITLADIVMDRDDSQRGISLID